MSATIGKDLETGMTTITFDSTGRMVQFTKAESDDFDLRMLVVKAQGSLDKESIGSKAAYALQLLGEAIVEGDPELIASIWLGTGEKIVEAAILNNVIEKIEYDNPFSLYHINDNSADNIDFRRALSVSKKVQEIIDNLIQAIIALEITCEYDNLLTDAVDAIKVYYNHKVGLSDTDAREAMVNYFEGMLEPVFDAVDYTQMRQDFFMHL